MSIRNQNWYNLQSTRRYPLDEASSGFDDTGALIRDDVLVDCHLRFPDAYGAYLYVQGITVSAGLVSIVFGAASGTGAQDQGEPVAAVTVRQPAMVNVNYPITPIKPGVSGWVTFGPGIDQPAAWRYATAGQTAIAPRCARPYRQLPIPTLGKLGLQAALEKVVQLSGARPVKVSYVENAGDVIRFDELGATAAETNIPAIVIELDTAQRTEAYDPLKVFLGPCGQRPESGTCSKPPIENINGIVPDCNGNIDIVFSGFDGTLFESCGGIDVLTSVDLAEVCDNTGGGGDEPGDDCCSVAMTVETEEALQNIPAEDRVVNMLVKTTDTGENWRLNSDLTTWRPAPADDACRWPDSINPAPDIIIDETVTPPIACLETPVLVGFAGCSSVGSPGTTTDQLLLDTVSGRFQLEELPAPDPAVCGEVGGGTFGTRAVYAAKNFNAMNVARLQSCDNEFYLQNKIISADVLLRTGGAQQRAGVVLKYLNSADVFGPQLSIITVALDRVAGSLRFLRYVNGVVAQEAAVPMVIDTDGWYRVSATVIPNGPTTAVRGLAAPINPAGEIGAAVQFTLNLATGDNAGNMLGAPGVFADRTEAYFNRFSVVDV